MEEQLLNLLNNYVSSLQANIHQRFDDALPVLSAFSIFDPLAVPNPGSPGFTDYGKKEVVILAKHFYSGNPKEHQLIAEWEKFKYDLASWKPAIPEEVKKSHTTISTEWCLTRLMKLQTSYSLVFPALVHIAEVCLSMPVSNAWPERGCSAVKRVKTRLRSRLSVQMLQTLLAITINGPRVGTRVWVTDVRCRRTMGDSEETKEASKASVAAPSTVADEVTVATTALNLAADSFFDEGIYSESEDSEEEEMFI